MTTCEVTITWSPIAVWWPMWLPLHMTTLSPIVTNGWIVLSSRMKQFSPHSKSGNVVAVELT